MKEDMPKLSKSRPPSLTVREIAQHLNCPFEGDGEAKIFGVASLEKAKPGDLVFLSHRQYRQALEVTKASAAIIPLEEKFNRIPVIRSENPYLSFIKAVELFFEPFRPEPGIHPSASISPSAKIGKDVSIGALASIGEEVEIGARTIIFPLVVLYPRVKIGEDSIIHSHVSIREEVQIGNRVTIHNGTVVGSDGFGYLRSPDGSLVKIPQKGIVIIEDDVEVGANVAIDRAALGETIIRKGTKIDNLVQVAHNVEIGPQSLLAAQTGIAGSTKIGKKVVMGGQVGVSDHLKIEDNVQIGAKSGIMKDIPANSTVAGIPHLEMREWLKAMASLPHLYELRREVEQLKAKLKQLEKKP